MPEFKLKKSLVAKHPMKGLWLASGSHVAAEIASFSGYDWCLIDMEHGLGSEPDTLRQIQALGKSSCAPVVRVPCAGRQYVSRCLDFGAEGIMLPMVNNAADAREFVRSLRYPPAGTRGMTTSSRASSYGFDFDNYFKNADSQALAIVQIETPAAVENADAIAAVEGVDALFIGHSDLSLQLGCFRRFDSPALLAAEKCVFNACARHGKIAGILMREGMSYEKYQALGVTLFAMGSDIDCMKKSFRATLRDK